MDKAFDEYLAFLDRLKEESAERLAKSGENPRMVLFGVDRENRRLAIVPVDPPSPAEGQSDDGPGSSRDQP